RTPGEGSVHRRKDGRWQASLQVHGLRRTVYGRTRAEVVAKLAELKRQAGGGDLPRPGRRTVNDLLDEWLRVVGPSLRPRTRADYEQVARLYIAPTLGPIRLARLQPSDLQRVISDLEGRGLRRAAAKAHAVLHRALALAVLWRWVGENVADRALRPVYRPGRRSVWSQDELQRFLAGAVDHWLYAAWVLALASGCRSGELRALTWADVDFDTSTIHIARSLQRVSGKWVMTPPKTRAGERTVTLPAEAMQVLRRQKARQAEWRLRAGPAWADRWRLVFTSRLGRPLDAAALSRPLGEMCRRLQLSPLTVHDLRHLHASLLLAEGLPVPAVAARMGHATPGVTLAVYGHLVRRRDDPAPDAIGRALGGRE
ncbi:MAG: site-specific integrase, partial [Anaerolineae bacterium]|nr:site-specific integrase [Anaerolineae bacterium]